MTEGLSWDIQIRTSNRMFQYIELLKFERFKAMYHFRVEKATFWKSLSYYFQKYWNFTEEISFKYLKYASWYPSFIEIKNRSVSSIFDILHHFEYE